MAEGKTPGNGMTSPFGNGNGATASGDSSGAHDFLTDPKGSGAAAGGRDFTKESRPQSDAKKEVEPNSQEIPAGGLIPKAAPGAASKTMSCADSTRKPFKGV